MSEQPPPAGPEPQFTMEPGWSPLLGILPASTGARFVSKDDSGQRLRVRYYRRDADGALMGKVWFGPGTEGPPGHAHGGAMAAVLDEAMGYGAWISGHAVVAARITVEFKTLLPLGAEVLLEAWVERSEGRKVHMRAHLLGPDVTELIQGYAIARGLETTQHELMRTIFPHPTLSEAMHESVLAAYDRVLHV